MNSIIFHPTDEHFLIKNVASILQKARAAGEEATALFPLYAALSGSFSSASLGDVKNSLSSLSVLPPRFCGKSAFFPVKISTSRSSFTAKIRFAIFDEIVPPSFLSSFLLSFSAFSPRAFRLASLEKDGFSFYISGYVWVKL